MGEQVPRGFWVAAPGGARACRGRSTPPGGSGPRASCLAGANRLVHALRARGRGSRRSGGDAAPATRPSCSRCCSRCSRPAGSTCRSTPTSPRPRSRTSSATRALTALVADDDLAAVAVGGRRRGGRPGGRAHLDRRCHPRLHPARRRCSPASPTRRPTTASPGSSCSTRRAPPGARRRCSATCRSSTRRPGSRLFSANLTRYDIEPGGDAVHLVTSPMYHMSPLTFGYFSLHFEHTVVLMERWDAERALAADRRATASPTWRWCPTQLHRLMAAARGRARAVRRVVAAPGDPRGGAVPGRAQAAGCSTGSAR